MRLSAGLVLGISIFLSLELFFLVGYKPQTGGDIVEYFGMTQSLRSHAGVSLTPEDQSALEKLLPAGYFSDPGYYIRGAYQRRYPVHFVAYSVFLLPFVILLETTGRNPLLVFAIANVFGAGCIVLWLLSRYTHRFWQSVVLLGLILVSPLASFFIWPGPDLIVMLLLLGAIFLFSERKFGWAAVLAALASWHSQPLAPLAGIFALLALIRREHAGHGLLNRFVLAAFAGAIVIVPYLFNLYAFRTLTPWTLLQDPWTLRYGFGLHNASLRKLFEQFFDLNMGVFWYMPALCIFAFPGWWQKQKTGRIHWLIPAAILLTAVFYQTNPAWHYGTSGYGPSRHALFIVPFAVYYAYAWISSLNNSFIRNLIFVLILGVQAFCLSLNGWLVPRLSDTLAQSPAAQFVLDRFPKYYEPTPEIFVDRTTHEDVAFLTTAIYKKNGVCKKAFVTPDGYRKLIAECGYIPDSVSGTVLTGGSGFYVTY